MPKPAHRAWYKTSRWQRMRARQLAAEPLCAFCLPRAVPATVADHTRAHRGDEALFWDENNLTSLCASCHSSDKQRLDNGNKPRPRIGLDGWPIG